MGLDHIPDEVFVLFVGEYLAFHSLSLSHCNRRFRGLFGHGYSLRDDEGRRWSLGVLPCGSGQLRAPEREDGMAPQRPQTPLCLSTANITPAVLGVADALMRPPPWLAVTLLRCDGDSNASTTVGVLLSAWHRAETRSAPCCLVQIPTGQILLAVLGGVDAHQALRVCGSVFTVLPGVFAHWYLFDARRATFVRVADSTLANNHTTAHSDGDALLLHVYSKRDTETKIPTSVRMFYTSLSQRRPHVVRPTVASNQPSCIFRTIRDRVDRAMSALLHSEC